MSNYSTQISGMSTIPRLIDVDLLEEPGTRYEIEALLGEGTFGEVSVTMLRGLMNKFLP